MHTLFDYITYVKGVEYIIAILSILGFILLWEVLKPRPFESVITSGKEDIEYIKQSGFSTVLKTTGKVIAAPFIGLAYVIAVPFAFFIAVGYAVVSLAFKGLGWMLGVAGVSTTFEWRPTEAYLGGKKKKKKEEGKKQ